MQHLTVRDQFEIPSDVTYLNCAFMSPLLKSVKSACEQAMKGRAEPWKKSSADFFTEVETTRERFASLVGADSEGVALVPSVSYGLSVAAANLPAGKGGKTIVLEDTFPSNYYIWKERGEVVRVAFPPDRDLTRAVLGAIDANTGIVAVPPSHWMDGMRVDLKAVRKRTREVGAALVVDVSQSLGAVPFNVKEIEPDFLVCVGYKWLLGPYGVSFLYVAPPYRQGKAIEQNWINRAGSEDFTRLTEYTDSFQSGARRFDMGQKSNLILLPMMIAALDKLLEWTPERMMATIAPLTALAEKRSLELGFDPIPAIWRAPHMIGVRLPARLKACDVSQAMVKERVFVSVRGTSLRISPNVYNTVEDIERCFEVLKTESR